MREELGESATRGNPRDGQWPLWRAAADPDASDADGYGHLARYVMAGHVFERYFRAGYRHQAAHDRLNGALRDQWIAEHLWAEVVARDIPYAEPPWDPADGQRLRDPDWLLRRNGAGTCIDLSLLFAGLCLNEGLDTFLLLLRGAEHAHVAVAIRPGQQAATEADALARGSRPTFPTATERTDTDGVLRVYGLEEFAKDDGLLLIDVTAAASGADDRTLPGATERARQSITSGRYSHVHLVDVAVRQRGCGDAALDPPLRHGALLGRIAPPGRRPLRFPAQVSARAALATAAGRVVIAGPQGTGKSTLAREIASAADGGFGWFLPATSQVAFEAALAESELAERGRRALRLEAEERRGLARSALERLRRSKDSWVIVLDNANAGAKPFDEPQLPVDRFPVPDPALGQLVIATSTAANSWPGWLTVNLPTLTADDIAAGKAAAGETADPQVCALAAGRPLLMAAFDALLSAAPDARAALPNTLPTTGSSAESSGAADADGTDSNDAVERLVEYASALYWAAARAHLLSRPADTASPVTESADRASPDPVTTAERLAWMPPDRLHPGSVAGVVNGDGPRGDRAQAAQDALFGIGLLGKSVVPGSYSMHRLFGAAVRAATTDDGRSELTARELLAVPAARDELLRHGDADVAASLAVPLAQTGDGLALWALAGLQEVHAVKLSADTYARAVPLLNPDDPEQGAALADCLMARGREVQRYPKSPEQIADAIVDMQRAMRLRQPDDVIGIAKVGAMTALLRQRAARSITDPTAKTCVLLEVRDILDDSWRKRSEKLGDMHPLVDRASFNRAGVRLSLAKADQANAGEHLAGAEEVYRSTLEFRRKFYTGPNPITAASIAGISQWGYEAVRLGVAECPDDVLHEAIDAAVESLTMRRATSNAADVAKSATVLFKLAVLQVKLATGAPEAAVADAVRELDILKPVLHGLKVDVALPRRLGLD